ncbi:MAG TPA: FtsQ-type POTRA domain-containing protein, partial [Candidatus Dormibacteraeota bacterium]
MTTLIDDRALSQARARALAASILDAPPPARSYAVIDPRALARSERRRRHARPAPPQRQRADRHPRRRAVVGLVLLAQLGALVALLAIPAFRVRTVQVQGAQLLSAGTVERLAGATTGQSIFTVDGEALRRRLLADPWVAAASVETALPATVRITVTERLPVLRVERAGGDVLVAAGGATLAVGDATGGVIPTLPLLEDQRLALSGRPAVIDASLLGVLADTAAHFSATYGCALAAFQWRADGVLTMLAAPGWTAVLGNVDDPDRVAAIPAQLAALASLKGRLDFARPAFGYVDLQDPAAPAVGGAPGQSEPAALAPAPAAPVKAPTPV